MADHTPGERYVKGYAVFADDPEYDVPFMVGHFNRVADAHLDAAAPDLLAALEAIAERTNSNLDEIPLDGGTFAEEWEDVASGLVRIRDDARAAIAAATKEADEHA